MTWHLRQRWARVPHLTWEAGVEELVGITAKGDAACNECAFNIRIDAVMGDLIVKATESAPNGSRHCAYTARHADVQFPFG